MTLKELIAELQAKQVPHWDWQPTNVESVVNGPNGVELCLKGAAKQEETIAALRRRLGAANDEVDSLHGSLEDERDANARLEAKVEDLKDEIVRLQREQGKTPVKGRG